MDAREIRGWLLVNPRPVSLRITTPGKTPTVLATNTGATWAEIGKSVSALGPELIEALDVQGQTIRAIRPADVDDGDEDEDEDEGIPVLPGHAESAMLVTFAKLIADAYKHSTDVAFERLGDLFNAMTARSIALERSLDSTMKLQLRSALEQAGGNNQNEEAGSIQELMAAFMKGQAHAAVDAAAKNGVAKDPTS